MQQDQEQQGITVQMNKEGRWNFHMEWYFMWKWVEFFQKEPCCSSRYLAEAVKVASAVCLRGLFLRKRWWCTEGSFLLTNCWVGAVASSTPYCFFLLDLSVRGCRELFARIQKKPFGSPRKFHRYETTADWKVFWERKKLFSATVSHFLLNGGNQMRALTSVLEVLMITGTSSSHQWTLDWCQCKLNHVDETWSYVCEDISLQVVLKVAKSWCISQMKKLPNTQPVMFSFLKSKQTKTKCAGILK